jgi:hypothetical protein
MCVIVLDNKGNWQGSENFNYFYSPYLMSLNGFSITHLSQYSDMINTFQQIIFLEGEVGAQLTLPFNLLLWISFIFYYDLVRLTLLPLLHNEFFL